MESKRTLKISEIRMWENDTENTYIKRLSSVYCDLVRLPYDKLDTGLQYTTILVSSLNTAKVNYIYRRPIILGQNLKRKTVGMGAFN
jgi:hypothetical protein